MTAYIEAMIDGISYKPLLCKKLNKYSIKNLSEAFSDSAFILEIDEENKFAVSWWVSPKRTRSYPYARVYDTLAFAGKKVTIIPIMKDEGADGDRDFLQWDTVSLMSLLGVYVIISYYIDAEKHPNPKYKNKITEQRFDLEDIKEKLYKLLNYHSDALHWNLEQLENIGAIAEKALAAYDEISRKLNVKMHSKKKALKKIEKLKSGVEEFRKMSRNLAKKAQEREVKTIQPKENITGKKGAITIRNYLGGYYYFTVDEIEICGDVIYLIEAKHSNNQPLPSESDIKDGLLKMILYTNLKDVILNERKVKAIPVLKLTTSSSTKLSYSQRQLLDKVREEGNINGFKVCYMKECLKFSCTRT